MRRSNAPKLNTWVSISDAARLADTPRRTMARRLWVLHERTGNVLLRVGPRKLLANVDAIAKHFAPVVVPEDSTVEILALRAALRALARRVTKLEASNLPRTRTRT